jgi:acyl-CoA reductase-like NAD-dependent aldehyde dehydrogenase
MLKKQYPYYLANKPYSPNTQLSVFDKFTDKLAAQVALADHAVIEQAIQAAVLATEPMRKMPAYERKSILEYCVRRLKERAEELAMGLCIEAGKPIRDARGEVERLIDTFQIAAEESIRIYGEILPLDISPRTKGYAGFWMRFPIGPCSFIAPFNFPLNLVAHKVAPAIAAGCPFVLKPASLTPIGALIIGEILAETSLPPGAFSILPCSREEAEPLITDERLKLLSFTGSDKVGWAMKAKAGKKSVVLELGGNAACIVDEGVDLDDVVNRLITGAFYQSGQSCISVQRILIHRSIYASLKDKMVQMTKTLKCGDPKEPDTFVGPMISEQQAERLQSWIQEAVAKGATLLCGGKRQGTMMEPTLLEGVPLDEKINREEAFGPLAILSPFEEFDEALKQVNESRYGLQAGVFTQDLYKAQKAWNTLEVGGVIIGDVPSWRVDHMPYGGVKDSGLGREGIRFAIQHMTEIKMIVIRH